jgi:hypothetical protein
MIDTTIDLSADVIDVREIIERIEAIEAGADDCDDPAWKSANEDEAGERDALYAIMSDLAGYGGDEQWRGDWYPASLIADSYFEDYARELADDTGAVDANAGWPNNFIDWKRAAEALQSDYTSVEIDGRDYWYR